MFIVYEVDSALGLNIITVTQDSKEAQHALAAHIAEEFEVELTEDQVDLDDTDAVLDWLQDISAELEDSNYGIAEWPPEV